jgi:lysozyme
MVDEPLLSQIKFEEGLRLEAYHCTAGKKTIGYGHNLDAKPLLEGNRIPDVITKEIAEVLLHNDVERTMDMLDAVWPGYIALRGARRDACINMAFQLGVARFMQFSKMREAIEKLDWRKAHFEALNSYWARQTPERAARVASQFITGEHYAVPHHS